MSPGLGVNVPPQVLLAPVVLATARPLGKASVSEVTLAGLLGSGLVNVMVRVELPPALMVAGLKALLTVGGMGVTGEVAHTERATWLDPASPRPFAPAPGRT